MLGNYLHRVFRATEELNRQHDLAIDRGAPGRRPPRLRVRRRHLHAARRRPGRCGREYTPSSRSPHGPMPPPRALPGRSGHHRRPRPALPVRRRGRSTLVHANQLIEHLRWPDRVSSCARSTASSSREPRWRCSRPTTSRAGTTSSRSPSGCSRRPCTRLVRGDPGETGSTPCAGLGSPVAEDEDTHLRLFSFQGFRELLDYHRFEVLDLRTAGFYPPGRRGSRGFSPGSTCATGRS